MGRTMAYYSLRKRLFLIQVVTIFSSALLPRINALDRNICNDDSQCLNYGVCRLSDDGFKRCRCSKGFEGWRCEKYCPLHCQNDGRCEYKGDTNDPSHYYHKNTDKNDFQCKCKGYFTGDLCEIPYQNCAADGVRCYHDGTCVTPNVNSSSSSSSPTATATCICADGYMGNFCQDKDPSYVSGTSAAENREDPAPRNERSGFVVGLIVSMSVVFSVVIVGIVKQRRRYSKVPRSNFDMDIPIQSHMEVEDALSQQRWKNIV